MSNKLPVFNFIGTCNRLNTKGGFKFQLQLQRNLSIFSDAVKSCLGLAEGHQLGNGWVVGWSGPSSKVIPIK